MTIRTADVAFLELFGYAIPAVFRNHAAHIVLFATAHMIEFQNYRIRSAAIHAAFAG
jgi:hypothetical protein